MLPNTFCEVELGSQLSLDKWSSGQGINKACYSYEIRYLTVLERN